MPSKSVTSIFYPIRVSHLPSLILLEIIRILQVSPCSHPTMMHSAISLNFANLARSTENFSVLLHDSFILPIGGQYDVRNGDLFGILFGETTIVM